MKYTPRVSTAASLFAYFAPPLPVSAYVFGWEQGVGGSGGVEAGIDALVTQQREYALASLTEGPAALPKGMVSAMLPAVSVAVSRAEKAARHAVTLLNGASVKEKEIEQKRLPAPDFIR